MEKIKIVIPDNLTPDQELMAIAKQLGKKLLPKSGTKLIGSGYEIKHLDTQINISREPVEKAITTRECVVCKTVFEQSKGKKLWTNYGGLQRKHYYCSDDCRNVVFSIAGSGRAAISPNKLRAVYK